MDAARHRRHGRARQPVLGDVNGMSAARHTSAQLVRFVDQVIATHSPRREILLIADDRSAQTTNTVAVRPVTHPRVTLHDTPTSRLVASSRRTLGRESRQVRTRRLHLHQGLRRTVMQYLRLHRMMQRCDIHLDTHRCYRKRLGESHIEPSTCG